jgi:hypothetical protein
LKPTILIFFIVFSSCLYAQDDPKIIVHKSQKEKEKELNSSKKNTLRLSPLELFSGDLPIYYERVISKKLSIELGIGLTYIDFLGNLATTEYTPIPAGDRSAKLGYSYFVGIQYYPSEVLKKLYFSAQLKYRIFNWERLKYENSQTIQLESTKSYLMPRLNIGYIAHLSNIFTFEYFGGFGLASVKNTVSGDIYNDDTNEFEYTMFEKDRLKLRIHFGFKMGILF